MTGISLAMIFLGTCERRGSRGKEKSRKGVDGNTIASIAATMVEDTHWYGIHTRVIQNATASISSVP